MRQPSGASVAAGAARGERWLRADLGDAVRVERRGDGSAVLPPAELEGGLQTWSGRLSRSRALVVARRWLLLGLIVALIPAVVILAVGGSRPWWLFAVVLVGPIAGLIAAARRPSPARTARVLDRRLGLADRLTTALELRSAPVAPTGLGGLVVDEASSALGQSLGNERAIARRSPRELAWLVAAAVALAVLIAVPRPGSSTTGSTRASAGSGVAHGGAGAGASPTRSGRAAAGRTTIPSATPLPRPQSPNQLFKTGGGHYNPSANPYASNPYGGKYRGAKFNVKQQQDKPTGPAPGLALATPGGANTPPAPAAGAAGSSSSNQPVSGAGAGQSGIKTPSGAHAALAPTGGAGGAAGAAASHGGAGAGASGGANAPGASAGAHGSQSGTQSGSGGQSGGETAGGVRAGQTHGVGLVPALGGSGKGLPLQGSLAGSRASRSGSHGGISSRANGGGGYARGVQASSGAAGGGGVNLPVLAPTFNSSSQPEPGLLQRYFGAANRLAFKAW